MATEFVGIAEMKISSHCEVILTAANLGSCLGIAVYDPVGKQGGMIHCLLPLSKADPEKAATNPRMYVDTGFPLLLNAMLERGADKKKLIIIAAGGANINDSNNVFEIGKKNFTIFRKLLWKNGLLAKSEQVGDSFSRTLSLEIGSGRALLKANGETVEL